MPYKCPYCNSLCVANSDVVRRKNLSFYYDAALQATTVKPEETVVLTMGMCPACHKVSVALAPYFDNDDSYNFSFSYPPANAFALPSYIPAAIRADYLEAVSIVNLSPKASATLARRCLQGMIHDFWGIKEKNLNAEISSLQSKIPAAQWKAIDGLRKIGNIGAHMEKDVELIIDIDQDEARKLIKLIELLLQQWYVARHDEEQLLAEITAIADEKDAERHSSSVDPNGQ